MWSQCSKCKELESVVSMLKVELLDAKQQLWVERRQQREREDKLLDRIQGSKPVSRPRQFRDVEIQSIPSPLFYPDVPDRRPPDPHPPFDLSALEELEADHAVEKAIEGIGSDK